MKWVWVNQIWYENEAPINTNNRAFLYADGFFETCKIENSKWLLEPYHLKRILKTFKALQFNPISNDFSSFIYQKFNQITPKYPDKKFRLKIIFFRNSKGYYTPETNHWDLVLELEEYNEKLKTIHSIEVLKQNFKCIDPYSFSKSINSRTYVMAGLERRLFDTEEAILLNNEGRLCEALSSNIFLIKNGIILTPEINEGPIDGVFRNFFLDIAKKLKLQIFETRLQIQDLENADEVFLTNSLAGIRPVLKFRDRNYQIDMGLTLKETIKARWLNE